MRERAGREGGLRKGMSEELTERGREVTSGTGAREGGSKGWRETSRKVP